MRVKIKQAPALRIDILTLFPKVFDGPLGESMIRLAQRKGLVEIQVHNLRKWTHDRHKTCDDKPFGGGPGMVMKVEPIAEALGEIRKKGVVVMLSPRGKPLNPRLAWQLSRKKHLVLICGHYEGVDERVHRHLVDFEISVGDFITTCGEFPALCVLDAVSRLVPGVLGNRRSLESESFQNNLLEYSQYTRPAEYRGWKVPEVLRSGVHADIEIWRKADAVRITKQYRPDLWKRFGRITRTNEKTSGKE